MSKIKTGVKKVAEQLKYVVVNNSVYLGQLVEDGTSVKLTNAADASVGISGWFELFAVGKLTNMKISGSNTISEQELDDEEKIQLATCVMQYEVTENTWEQKTFLGHLERNLGKQ